MRWIAYFILAYLAIGLQVGLGGYLRIDSLGAAPNLVLLAVIFIAVNAPRESALLGCFVLGLFQDMLTLQPLGVYALSYGLVGMFVISTQAIVYREHPLTHVSLALLGGIVTGIIILTAGLARSLLGTAGATAQAAGGEPLPLLFATLYTAVLAPFVLGVLQRVKRLFAFEPPRRRSRV